MPRVKRRQRIDVDGLRKSFYDKDGIRYRWLRKRDNERWQYLGLPIFNGVHFAYIYTVEQALERNIQFRKDWQKPSGVERNYYSQYVYSQKNDWVVTEVVGPLDEFWVMQVLWRNEFPGFEYIRTPTGSYVIGRSKPFDGVDIQGQFTAGGNVPYHGNRAGVGSQRQHLLTTFIACLIKEKGFFNKNIVSIAYKSAYGDSCTWRHVAWLMESEKIMTEIAKKLKELLNDHEVDEGFVVKQLKEMAEQDYDKEPTRRERTVRLLGLMQGIPTLEDKKQLEAAKASGKTPMLPPGEYVDAEEVEAQDDLGKVNG